MKRVRTEGKSENIIRNRLGYRGEALAETLSKFSLDVLSLIAAYETTETPSKRWIFKLPSLLMRFDPRHHTMVVERRRIFVSTDGCLFVYDIDPENGNFTDVSHRFPVDHRVSAILWHEGEVLFCSSIASIVPRRGWNGEQLPRLHASYSVLSKHLAGHARAGRHSVAQFENKIVASINSKKIEVSMVKPDGVIAHHILGWGGITSLAFTKSGKLVCSTTSPSNAIMILDGKTLVETKRFGGLSTDPDTPGCFMQLTTIAVDPKGYIWACDWLANKIHILSEHGDFITMFEVPTPYTVCFDNEHHAYVLQQWNGERGITCFAL